MAAPFLFNFPTHIVIDEVFYTADLKMIKSCGSVISREGFVFRGHIRHGAEKHSKCGPIIPCISIMIATTIDVIIAVNASSVKLIDKLGCRIAADIILPLCDAVGRKPLAFFHRGVFANASGPINPDAKLSPI